MRPAHVAARRHAEQAERLVHVERRRARLGHLGAPRVQHGPQQPHGVGDGPVREALLVAEVTEVVVGAPQLRLEVGVVDGRDGAVVVERAGVGREALPMGGETGARLLSLLLFPRATGPHAVSSPLLPRPT